jgi:putative cell wall-binding protein
MATAGTAFAFQSAGGGAVAAASNAPVFPGVNSQALGNVTVTLPDGNGSAGNGWAAGDFLKFTLTSDAAGTTTVCNTSSNLNDSASLAAKPTVSATTNGTPALTGFTVSQSASGTCNANDQFTIALTSAAPADTNNTVFTISGLSLNLGSAVPSGTAVYVSATSSNGAPFAGGVAQASDQVATVGSNSVSVSPVVGAANGTAAVAISPIVVTDVTGGTITTELKLTANGGDTFAAAGTLAAPSGVTVTGPAETLPSATLTYTIAAGTVPAGGKFTLPGVTVNLANAAGSHKVTVGTGAGGAIVVGAATGTEYATTAAQVRTYAGIDRYGTAQALYHAQFAGSATAVLTSGANFPDALSAAALAHKYNTGILLTDPNTLSQATQQELMSDPIQTVYIVGGTAAVSTNVASTIAAMHILNNPNLPLINVIRVAGSDRYATNNSVDLTTGAPGGVAVVATGLNFADALAVSPIVYAEGYVLVLTDPNTLSASAQSTLINLGIRHVVIVGGTSAVSSSVESTIKGLNGGITIDYRVAGADRTSTAATIATWATAGLPATSSYGALNTGGLAAFNGAGKSTVFLTRGDNFPDALAAGPVAGAQGHLIILSSDPNTLGPGAPTYLGGMAGTITTISALGYAAAVSPALVNAATAALG